MTCPEVSNGEASAWPSEVEEREKDMDVPIRPDWDGTLGTTTLS